MKKEYFRIAGRRPLAFGAGAVDGLDGHDRLDGHDAEEMARWKKYGRRDFWQPIFVVSRVMTWGFATSSVWSVQSVLSVNRAKR